MNSDNRNVILAVVLSMIVLFGWQFFIAGPQLEQAQRQAEIAAQQQAEAEQLAVPATNSDGSEAAAAADAPLAFADRDTALARRGAELTAGFVRAPYELVVLPGLGHWVPTRAPELLAEIILARAGSSGTPRG